MTKWGNKPHFQYRYILLNMCIHVDTETFIAKEVVRDSFTVQEGVGKSTVTSFYMTCLFIDSNQMW